jgi:hypothetical protein
LVQGSGAEIVQEMLQGRLVAGEGVFLARYRGSLVTRKERLGWRACFFQVFFDHVRAELLEVGDGFEVRRR